jgi:hypothetical protein
MMTRRILAIVAAFALSIVGHVLVFVGGVDLLLRMRQFAGEMPSLLSLLAVIAGLVLIAGAAATVAVSSAGVIVLGALHVVYGLLMAVLPFSFDARPPTIELTILLRNLNVGLGDGLLFHFMFGTGLLTGIVLLVAGLAARGRRGGSSLTLAFVSIAVSILGFVGVFVAVTGGWFIYRSSIQFFSGRIEFGGIALVLLGAVLVAATVVTMRWSSAGVITLGAVLLLVNIAWGGFTRALFPALNDLSHDLASSLDYVCSSGLLAIVAVALIGVGVGASVRARRNARMVAPVYAPAPTDLPPPSADPQVV